MTSAENALGIDAQPLTAASPFAHISRSLFARTSDSSSRFGDDRPAGLAERAGALAAFHGPRIVRGPVAHAAHDALRDGAETEQRERDVKVPVLDRPPPGLFRVGGDVFGLGRDAHRGKVEALDPAERLARTHVVG